LRRVQPGGRCGRQRRWRPQRPQRRLPPTWCL